MKLIIAGSTGHLATGLIRNALSSTSITKIIALGRRDITAPTDLLPNADLEKLKSVVLKDFMAYDDVVKAELGFADAVIWLALPFHSSEPASNLLSFLLIHDSYFAVFDLFSG